MRAAFNVGGETGPTMTTVAEAPNATMTATTTAATDSTTLAIFSINNCQMPPSYEETVKHDRSLSQATEMKFYQVPTADQLDCLPSYELAVSSLDSATNHINYCQSEMSPSTSTSLSTAAAAEVILSPNSLNTEQRHQQHSPSTS
jgi:hypothetical protein